MPKSQYPNNYDTSKEIPLVRDNVTEISGDIINSLRSAIIQVERTLGINPQGASGNTVASRIGNVIDESGNLKKEAISSVGLLSGLIYNSDVSEVAAILETKLSLDFPTRVLQTEISEVQKELDNIIQTIEELQSKFAVHINHASLDRHKALSISVEPANTQSSSLSTRNLKENTLQDAMELLYNAHINYSGGNISSQNNSHSATQVYFDNNNVNFTSSNSVQGAIEDLSNIQSVGIRKTVLNLNSNGRVRTGELIYNYEDGGKGMVLAGPESVSFSTLSGKSTTLFVFNTPLTVKGNINTLDTFTLFGSATEDDNRSYIISNYTLDVDSNLVSVEVFGSPKANSTIALSGIVTRNIHKTYNTNGLNATVRFRSDHTNTPIIQLAHPGSATIITNGLSATNIHSSSRYIKLIIDNDAPITVDVYNSSVSSQTIESIIYQINKISIDNNYNFMAYAITLNNCKEIAISHIVPDLISDLKERSIKISAGDTYDASEALGLSSILDVNVYGSSGHSFHLNGKIYDNIGLQKTYIGSEISYLSSELSILSNTSSFISDGLKIGDIVNITNLSDNSDDGSYYIKSVSASKISLESPKSIFSSILSDATQVKVFRLGADVGQFTFEEAVYADGSILFDVFFDDNQDINVKKRAEFGGNLKSSGFYAVIKNISSNFIIDGEQATLSIGTDGFAFLEDPLGNIGESIFVGERGSYKVFSADKLSFIEIFVKNNSLPSALITSIIYGFDELTNATLQICRGTFSTSLGLILGEALELGIPSLIDKRKSGTIDETIVSQTFIERYIEAPRNEIRCSGIISGCLLSNVRHFANPGGEHYLFDVSSGVAYVNGIRHEIDGGVDFRVNAGSFDHIFVAINEIGCIEAGIENQTFSSTPKTPFLFKEVAHIAVFGSISAVTSKLPLTIIDLRLFIDKLDLKIANKIIVSPELHAGHFTTIKDAVNYCKLGKYINKRDITPIIFLAPGFHVVDETIILNLDIVIEGSGANSTIVRSDDFCAGSIIDIIPVIGGLAVSPTNSVFLIGRERIVDATIPYISGYTVTGASEGINKGVTLKNFTYKTNEDITGVLTFCELSQALSSRNLSLPGAPNQVYSKNAFFRFENINFLGPSTIYADWPVTASIGEYFIAIGACFTNDNSPPILGLPVEAIDEVIGNIIITNCYIKSPGLEFGSVLLRNSPKFFNIIASNNILFNRSPAQNDFTSVIFDEVLRITNVAVNRQVIEVNNVYINDETP